MGSTCLRQGFAVAVTLSLALLMVGELALAAIRYGAVTPPNLDVSLDGLHIVAATTDPRECRITLPCPGPYRESYIVWVFYTIAPDAGVEYGGRILSAPLKR